MEEKRLYKELSAAIKQSTQDLSNPRFIIQQACQLKHQPPHWIQRFTQGALSYPETWWAANIQIMAYWGWFGEHQKHEAVVRQAILTALIYFGLRDNDRTAKAVYAYVKCRIENGTAQVAGRIVGGAVTRTWLLKTSMVSEQLPRGFKKTLVKGGLAASQWCYVTYGAAMMAIASAVRSLEQIIWVILSGDYQFYAGPAFEVLQDLKYLDPVEEQHLFTAIQPLLSELINFNAHPELF